MKREDTMPPTTTAEPKAYQYRRLPFGGAWSFRLEPDVLVWQGPYGKGSLQYRDVRQVRVFKVRFLGSSSTYWSSILIGSEGSRVRLSSANRAGFRAIEDRTATYIPFVKELEARVAKANPQSRLVHSQPWLKRVESVVARAALGAIPLLKRLGRRTSTGILAALLRTVGPRLRGHRKARAHLKAAFPEMDDQAVDRVLVGMWDNIGRTIAEYAHFDELWQFDPGDPARSRIVMDPASHGRLRALEVSSEPALMFAAHLANWELPPHAATAFGRKIALVYRAPFVTPVAEELTNIRSRKVAGLLAADRTTPLRVREALRRGWMVGMLVDQQYAAGVEVMFFNRPCKVNPMLAHFARRMECAIYGSRVIRLPSGAFRFEVTDALKAPRDNTGNIDIAGTMQLITSIIEGWVREHPEQWLWLHKRWGDGKGSSS
jgi:Kdo2-lipid IVA lauroyltransferase/acyltransferase